MVMEELGERETIVEESRRRRGAQVAVTEVTQVVEIFGNGVCKIYLLKLKRLIAETLCSYRLQLQLDH